MFFDMQFGSSTRAFPRNVFQPTRRHKADMVVIGFEVKLETPLDFLFLCDDVEAVRGPHDIVDDNNDLQNLHDQ